MQNLIPAEFLGTPVSILDHQGRRWLTARDVGLCLGYADPSRKVVHLYHRHADEFGSDDTGVLNLGTNPQGGNPNVRIFSQTGCILLAMFANTPRAKDFRAWAKQALAAQAPSVPEPWADGIRPPRITRAVERHILELYAAGATLGEIGNAFAIDKSVVSRIVNGKYRFAPGSGVDETTPELRAAVARRIMARELAALAARRCITHNHAMQEAVDSAARSLLSGPVRALLPNEEA